MTRTQTSDQAAPHPQIEEPRPSVPVTTTSKKTKRPKQFIPCKSLGLLICLGAFLWIDSLYYPDSELEKGLSIFLNSSNDLLKSNLDPSLEAIIAGVTLIDGSKPKMSDDATISIAYAISITHCNLDNVQKQYKVRDGPAVLAHSIHMNSIQHSASKSKYDYTLYAFVHPQAVNCSVDLEGLNYTVQIVDTPVKIEEIKSKVYSDRLQNKHAGCCQEKEFLKLYSYTLHDYPIVVHLDADTLLNKPMDPLFDAMLQGDDEEKTFGDIAMYPSDRVVRRPIQSYFTRDYPMGTNSMKKPEHHGVQGGFWIVRPNQSAFEEYCHLIREGNFSAGWFDDDTKYPGFYGAAMIQGLVGWFYGHQHPGQAVELDRCLFNNMADDPWDEESASCNIPFDPECTDCRQKNFSDVYSFHFTFCCKISV